MIYVDDQLQETSVFKEFAFET